MKNLIILLLSMVVAISAHAQTAAQHHVVFQVTSNDSLVYKGLFNNIHHLKEGFGEDLDIEVVLHGPAIELAIASKTNFASQIAKWSAEGVDFMVCENTMKKKKVSHQEIVSTAKFVPMGLGEIILKQEQGWSYIKIGF